MSVGHSPDVPQFEPDIRKKEDHLKKEEHVMIEEKQEAKRRIEGSLAPAPSTDA